MIVSLGLALAVPTYQEMVQKRHTESRSEQFASFINHAHAEAVKRFEPITVNVAWTSEADWCAGAVLGLAACDCTGDDADNLCTIDGDHYTLAADSSYRAGMVDPDVSGNGVTFTFDPVRGILADDTESLKNHEFKFQSDSDYFEAEVSVMPTGRVSICSSGDHLLTTFDACR